MKKKLWCGAVVLILLLGCLILTGRSREEKKEKQENPVVIREDSEEKEDVITLEVYVWDDEGSNLRMLADAYEQEKQGIRIHINVIPSSEYSQQMMAIKEGKKAGDCVFFPHVAEAATWIEKDIVQDLKPWLDAEIEELRFAQWCPEDGKEYQSYMLPYRVSRWAVFYNVKLFEEKGIPFPEEDWTWEEYAQTAVLLTDRVGVSKTFGSLGFEPTSIWWRVPARTRGANNPLILEDRQMFREAAEWCYRLSYELEAQIPYTEQTGNQGRVYNELFLDGGIGMFFTGDWSVYQINQLMEEKKSDFVYDIAPLPGWEDEENYVLSDAAVASVTQTTMYPQEAYDFIRFVAGEKGAKLLAAQGTIPAWDTEEIKEIILNSTEIPEHMEYFYREGKLSSVPASVSYNEAMEIMRKEVSSYLLQEKSSDQCFDQIEKLIQEME